jgi:hypothetical protein
MRRAMMFGHMHGRHQRTKALQREAGMALVAQPVRRRHDECNTGGSCYGKQGVGTIR